jgi:hypothetical protein
MRGFSREPWRLLLGAIKCTLAEPKQGRTPILLLRVAVLATLLLASQAIAQDLPDPGRRLSEEEQKAGPEKPKPGPPVARPRRTEREEQACKSARIYYQLSCGAPGSYRSFGRSCAEADALYRQSCP